MMRKIRKLLFVAFVCCLAGGFSACNFWTGDEDFSSLNGGHQWVTEVVDATCTQDGSVYRYCSEGDCGAWSTSVGEKAKGHVFDERQFCTVCQQSLQSTAGLIYEIHEADTEKKKEAYATVIGYEGTPTNVTIGYTPDGLPIKEIGAKAFQNSQIASVTVCEIVEDIRNYAFDGCTNLTEIRLSDSVKRIEQGAFDNCSALKEIEIPKNVHAMSTTFDGCPNLTNIAVAEGNLDLKSIDGNLYYYEGRPYIKKKLFVMSKYAPGKKESSFEIPDGVTSISVDTFKDCESLKSVTLPDTLEWIGMGAFHGCTGLTEIIIPNGVKTIQSGAFHGCTGLTSVKIPAGVKEIQWKAFPNCTNLQEIIVEEGNENYISIDGNLYCKKGDDFYQTNTLIEYAFGKTNDTFTLPLGTEVIGDYAFHEVSGLKTVIIPESVREIEMFAFYDCLDLEKVYLPHSLTTLGDCVFRCFNLKEVVYNGTKEEWDAFESNPLNWLWIETTVKVQCKNGSFIYTREGFAINRTETFI